MPVKFTSDNNDKFISSLKVKSSSNSSKIQVQGALNENLPLISSIILALPQQVLYLGLMNVVNKYFCDTETMVKNDTLEELVNNFPLLVKTFLIQYLAVLKLPINEVLALF
jgi:hypothetical protein